MEKKVYYQAQFSEDGENWTSFNAHHAHDVRESLDEIREVYDRMVEWHSEPFNRNCKYHRIMKFTVESEEVAI